MNLYGLGGSIPALGMFQRLAKTDESTAAAKYGNTPAVKKELDYVKAQIAKMKSPDELYKNYRVMKFVLSAYGLESELQYIGRIKKVLESDMSDDKSLANSLRDARYRQIASALNIKATGLATLKSSATLDAITQKYLTNEYEKSFEGTNPAIREGLYFLRNIGNVSSVYEILGDPVLRKVVTTTLGLPDQIAVQSIESQAQLITKRLDVTKFHVTASTTTGSTRLANAQSDLDTATKLLNAGDVAANAARSIADKLQAIKSAYDKLAAVQSPTGVNAAEIPVQSAAVPQLLRQQGLVGAAQTSVENVADALNRMSALRGLAADPANAGSLAAYKTEFAGLAQTIHDEVATGATYRFNGTDQNLLDGSIAGAISAQVDSGGHTATLNPANLTGFLAQVDNAASAFAAVTGSGDTANLDATRSAIQAGGPQLGAVRDQLAADASAIGTAVGQVTTWAVTLDSAVLGTGAFSVSDAQSRTDQIATKLEQLKGAALESTLRPVGEDRSDLTAKVTTLIGDITSLVNNAATGADNLLAGGDKDYAIGGGTTLTAQGRDFATSVLSQLSGAAVDTTANAQALIAKLNGPVKTAVDSATRELAIDADVFGEASAVLDPRGKIDADFRQLAADIPGLMAAANATVPAFSATGSATTKTVNLLLPGQAGISAVMKLDYASINLPAQTQFEAAVSDVATAAVGQLPGGLSGAGGAYEQLQNAIFAANQAISALEPGRRAARDAISTAQRVIQDAGTSSTSTKAGIKATDFAKAFVNRYLGLKDAAALNGDSSVNGSSDVRLQLMSAAGGSTSLLA
jgi:hypothetical protein